jgi:formylglycine-generating enzyme
MNTKLVYLGGISLLAWSCSKGSSSDGSGGASTASGGRPPIGGALLPGGTAATGGSLLAGNASVGAGGTLPMPVPKYHPPPGFESCKHAEVKADCEDGWCRLPPSCFVMGSPEDEWKRGRDDENQTAVILTHSVEIQQKELTRAEWESISKAAAPGPDDCADANCPVATVTWWDAVTLADLLSTQKGLSSCYEPTSCTGTLGKDLTCAGVKDPEKSVYECEGYRLPTRAEAEYAARAGTISTFYSGDITVYADDTVCNIDPALELIAWYCWNSGGKPHLGGQLQPNGFGLYDLVGNANEWSSEPQQYASSPGGPNPVGFVGTGERRLRFGGQYDHKNYLARTASLLSSPWGSRGPTGFRLVRTLDPER